MKPEDVRFRNFIQPDDFPHKTISGYVYDSGDYPSVLKKCLSLAETDSWRKQQSERLKEGRYIGIGMAYVVEPAGLSSPVAFVEEPAAISAPSSMYNGVTEARIRLAKDGTIQVLTDWTEIGQGSAITATEVVSSVLGARATDVIVKPGTSDVFGYGPQSSRGVVYSLSAIVKAAEELRNNIEKVAGAFLAERPAHIEIRDSVISSSKHPERRMTLRELAHRVWSLGAVESVGLEEHETVLDVSASWYSPNTSRNPTCRYTTFCSSADIAVVELDANTGFVRILKYAHVHDAGKIINKEAVYGQIYGGIAQGIGEALREELIYDSDGRLLTNSYTDFVMPTALDMPDIVVAHVENPSPFTALGQKGIGESGIISSKAACISAIENALDHWNVTIDESPATMERIHKWIAKSKQT